ncbi:MAG: hypothetical protein LC624_04670, partial [Halobacteriales archaeon]|nr:hypothetical protein [Halobacteriales archaeon]
MAPSTPLTVAVLGLFVLIAGGAVLVIQPSAPVTAHQLPPLPDQGAPGAPTLAPPLVIDGPLTAPTRVRVVSPVDNAITLVEVDVQPTSTLVFVGGEQMLAAGAAAPLTVQGDILHDPVVTMTFTTTAGNVGLRVDRGTAPATITLSGLPSGPVSVQAPVAVQGDLTDPRDIAVYDVASSTPASGAGAAPVPALLFRYHDNGDGTATLRYLDPSNGNAPTDKTVQQQLLVLDGSPVADHWRLIVKDATGHPELQFDVPLDVVRGALASNNVDTGPVVNVVRNALPGTNAYKAASDGPRTLDPARLDGTQFLSGMLPIHIVVDVAEHTDLAAPWVQLSAPGQPAAMLRSHRDAAADGWVRFLADVPADWLRNVPDGSAVRFSVVYRMVDAKVMTDQTADDNDGAGYVFKVDQAGPHAPVIQAQLDAEHPGVLHVAWSATDAASGVATYAVQKGKLVDGAVTWEDWVHATPQGGADFAGEPGMSYAFKVTATDNVGNAGPAGITSQPVLVPAGGSGGSGGENHAPTIQLLQPTGGESFLGVRTLE